MTDTHTMTEREGLELIQKMIGTARKDFKDDGYFYLLWGWLVLVGCISHYALLTMGDPAMAAIPWAIVIPIGIGLTIWEIRKRGKQEQARSHLYALTQFLWIGIGACYFMLSGVMLTQAISIEATLPMYMMLYGLGAFIAGSMINFYPQMMGAVICWILTLFAFFVSMKFQLLLMAMAIISAYLVPGYWLKRRG